MQDEAGAQHKVTSSSLHGRRLLNLVPTCEGIKSGGRGARWSVLVTPDQARGFELRLGAFPRQVRLREETWRRRGLQVEEQGGKWWEMALQSLAGCSGGAKLEE